MGEGKATWGHDMGNSYWRLHLLANEGEELLRALGGIHPQARKGQSQSYYA